MAYKFNEDEELPEFDPNAPSEDELPEFDPNAPSEDEGDTQEDDGMKFRDSITGDIIEGIGKQIFDSDAPGLGYNMPIIGPAASRAGDYVSAALSSHPFDKALLEAQKAREDKVARFEKDYPAAANVGAFGTSMALPFGQLGKLVKGSGFLGSLGRGAANVAEGAAVAGADRVAAGRPEEALPAATKAAETGSYIQGGLSLLSGLGHGYSRFMAGLRPETIQRYKDRHARINDITEEGILDEANEALRKVKGGFQDQRDTIKRTVDKNKELARDRSVMASEEARTNYVSRKADAGKAYDQALLKEMSEASRATQAAKDKAKSESSALAMQADELERGAAESLSGTMMGARKKISQASGEAMQALDNYGGEIPLKWYKGQLTRGVNQNKIGKAILPNEGVDSLLKYRGVLDQVGKPTMTAVEAKKLIQSIDADLQQAYANAGVGGYNTPAVRSLMAMRRLASARLKRDVPEYGEAMKPVAEMTGRSKALQREFPNPEADKILPKLKGVGTTSKRGLEGKIQAAEESFGGDALSKLRQSADARNQAKGLADQEFGYTNQQYIDFLKGKYDDSLMGLDAQRRGAMQAGASQKAADMRKIAEWERSKLDPLKAQEARIGGIGEDSMQSKIQRYGNDPSKNIMGGRKLDALAEMGGMEPGYLTQAADDLAVKRAMEGTFTRGSRNVNLASKSLAGFAQMLGLGAAPTGATQAVGAIVGGMSDIMGPSIVKGVIDFSLTPAGQRFAGTIRRAAAAGPQALAQEYVRLLRENPDFAAGVEASMQGSSEGYDGP